METPLSDKEANVGLSDSNAGLGAPDLYWHQDADYGYECPDDAAIVGNMPLGTEFELTAAWYQTKKFKVVKVADDVSDDIEVIEVPQRKSKGLREGLFAQSRLTAGLGIRLNLRAINAPNACL